MPLEPTAFRENPPDDPPPYKPASRYELPEEPSPSPSALAAQLWGAQLQPLSVPPPTTAPTATAEAPVEETNHGDPFASMPATTGPPAEFAYSARGSVRIPRRAVHVGIALLVLAAVVAAAFAVLSRGDRAVALALSLRQGERHTYRVHTTFNGQVRLGTTVQPIAAVADGTMSLIVREIETDGSALVDLESKDVTGTLNGKKTGPKDPTTITVRITPDGRVLTTGDSATLNMGGPGTGIPGTDQMTPILPDHPVSPGDTWTKTVDQANPLGDGRIHYVAHNRFDRYENVAGTNTAVITTTFVLPVDLTFDFAKLTKLHGDSSSPSGLPKGSHPVIHERGYLRMAMTNWFNQAQGRSLKSVNDGRFDINASFTGLASNAPVPRTMAFTGHYTMALSQVP